jgi:septal ring factor EnvC (AmiA/AmiB activator)
MPPRPPPEEAPSVFDPERTRIHLLPRHLIALAAFLVAAVSYAYTLRAEVLRLGLRLDGLGDAPGLSARINVVEQRENALQEDVRVLSSRITTVQTQVTASATTDVQDRKALSDTLRRIEDKLKGRSNR